MGDARRAPQREEEKTKAVGWWTLIPSFLPLDWIESCWWRNEQSACDCRGKWVRTHSFQVRYATGERSMFVINVCGWCLPRLLLSRLLQLNSGERWSYTCCLSQTTWFSKYAGWQAQTGWQCHQTGWMHGCLFQCTSTSTTTRVYLQYCYCMQNKRQGLVERVIIVVVPKLAQPTEVAKHLAARNELEYHVQVTIILQSKWVWLSVYCSRYGLDLECWWLWGGLGWMKRCSAKDCHQLSPISILGVRILLAPDESHRYV